MCAGDLRPHKKILTCVSTAVIICLIISFYKNGMSNIYIKDSYRSECQDFKTRSDMPLPSSCYEPKPSSELSNVPSNGKVEKSKIPPAVLPARRKVEELRSSSSQKGNIEKKAETDNSAKADIEMKRFKFTINEENLCKSENGSSIVLIVGVFSGLDESPIRKYIRANWGNIVNENHKVKIVFILGEPKENSLFDDAVVKIHNESKIHHDIVQANFADTYRNLTLKSLALFQWIGSYCHEAKYVLKIDGDMKIDLSHLLSVLEKGNFPDKYQCGYLIPAHTPLRDKNSKWYVPISLFPRNYPLYCSGPAYIVSKRIAEKISHYPIPKIPFPVDDAFMTGVLREELKESVEKRIISFYHHHNPTDTMVQEGKFKKYIMKIDVRG